MLLIWLCTFFLSVSANSAGFGDGPVIRGFGNHAAVKMDQNLDDATQLKVVFDIAKTSQEGTHNRHIDSVARFLNMNVANGVLKQNIDLAIVVHGKAAEDLLHEKAYGIRHKQTNPSADLIKQLLEHDVKIFLCGQSAAYHGIDNTDLIKGVQMSLSAMTAHALLSQQGYSLNPF